MMKAQGLRASGNEESPQPRAAAEDVPEEGPQRRRGHSEDGGREYRPAKRHLQGGETGFVMEIGLAGQQGQKRWPWEGLCADYF